MRSLRRSSAYGGRGFRPRKGGLSGDIASKAGLWASWRVDSEFKPLEAALLCRPGAELSRVRRPDDVQHLARIDVPAVRRELDALGRALRRLGVAVFEVSSRFDGGGWPERYNLMYMRDLFLNTREGAVVSRMASAVRAGEEKHAALALAGLGVPINRTISGSGLFEGADALWLDARTAVCGVGNRTNAEGFRQLRAALRAQAVETLAVSLPRGAQHLLGLLQIVDARLALVRSKLASRPLLALLRRRGFRLVCVPETTETTLGQGMNVVTVAPRRIVMPSGCPELARLYRAAGLTIAAQVDAEQLARGAGGLACATGILSRRA